MFEYNSCSFKFHKSCSTPAFPLQHFQMCLHFCLCFFSFHGAPSIIPVHRSGPKGGNSFLLCIATSLFLLPQQFSHSLWFILSSPSYSCNAKSIHSPALTPSFIEDLIPSSSSFYHHGKLQYLYIQPFKCLFLIIGSPISITSLTFNDIFS